MSSAILFTKISTLALAAFIFAHGLCHHLTPQPQGHSEGQGLPPGELDALQEEGAAGGGVKDPAECGGDLLL